MSAEYPATLLIEKHDPIDEYYAGQLSELLRGPEAYKLLRLDPDREAAEKKLFLDAYNNPEMPPREPDLRPDDIDVPALEQRIEALQALEQEVLASQTLTDGIRYAYLWRIREKIAKLHIAKAAAEYDDTAFDQHSQEAYGIPSFGVYVAAVDALRQKAKANLTSADPKVNAAAAAALTALKDLPQGGDAADLAPADTVFQRVHNQLWAGGGFFSKLFAGVELPPDTHTITSAIGNPIIDRVKANLGIDHYKTVDGPWGVSTARQELSRPKKYSTDRDHFFELLAHEIGAHSLEAENGLRQEVQLLGRGLAWYERTNEGRAVALEQLTRTNYDQYAATERWEAILLRHVAVSAALGMGEPLPDADGQPTYIDPSRRQSFRQVYSIVYPFMLQAELARHPDDMDQAVQLAQDRAWGLLIRVYKGTDGSRGADGNLRSGPYLKDAVYLEGNVTAWDNEARQPGAIEHANQGKFGMDPFASYLLAEHNI